MTVIKKKNKIKTKTNSVCSVLSARRVTSLPSQKSDPAFPASRGLSRPRRERPLLAGKTSLVGAYVLFFMQTPFVNYVKEMYEKLARPG